MQPIQLELMASDNKPYAKQFAIRIFWFTFFGAVIIAGTVVSSVFSPAYHVYSNDDWDDFSYTPTYNTTKYNILFDSHSHTLASDGKLTPEQNILWHIAMGFNAMALTDHHNYDNCAEIIKIAREKYSDKIVVLPGTEWTTYRIHMNLIFPPDATGYEHLVSRSGWTPTDDDIKNIIKDTHGFGGIVIVNHIPWSHRTMGVDKHPTRLQLLDWGVDYIETVNEAEWDQESYDFCIANGLGLIAGTDMHSPGKVWGYTLMNVSEFSEAAVFNALKNRETDVLFLQQGTPYDVEHPVNPVYVWTRPLTAVGSIFTSYFGGLDNIDWLGIGIMAMYLYGIFIIAELIRVGNRKFWEKRNNK
jgi:predicted metal-dependent phosphoesterase TrpH